MSTNYSAQFISVYPGVQFRPANGEFCRSKKKNFQSFAGPHIFFAGQSLLSILFILFSPGDHVKRLFHSPIEIRLSPAEQKNT